MVTFDKLKLVADVNAIDIIDEEPFEKIEKVGKLPSYKYYQEVPFLLMIKIDYQKRKWWWNSVVRYLVKNIRN